jgi:solute carrier family 25 (mitochondrial carnitine/acylcarnitine transporter), member 20/29
MVLSAPYPGSKEDEGSALFHEWQLERPSDILQVHFLIQNIDRWTVGKFRDLVVNGVTTLVGTVVNDGGRYGSWRRCGDIGLGMLARNNKENVRLSTSTSSVSSSPQVKRTRQIKRR